MATFTKVATYYDTTSKKEIMNVRLHLTSGNNDAVQTFVVSSVWKNKNYDFSTLRKEATGKAYFNFQEGAAANSASMLAEVTEWNALAGNQVSMSII